MLGVLRAQAAQAAAMCGCLEFSLSVGDGSVGHLLVLQRWEDKSDLRRYLRSDLFRRELEIMELSVSPPEFRFYEVQESTGLEGVDEARDISPQCASPVPDALTRRGRGAAKKGRRHVLKSR